MIKASVLIVDDRGENLLALEHLLEEPGVDIVKAASGLEALEKTLDHEFALILMDVQMPGMDGYEAAGLLRGNRRTRHVPIIFVTAVNKDQSHRRKGYVCGAVDYLFRPLNPGVLRSKVSVFLDLYRSRTELEKKRRTLDRKVSQLKGMQNALKVSNEKLRVLSCLDGLTGLPNRRMFDEIYIREWRRAVRDKKDMGFVLADIDNFKAYNDHYGHLEGDDCLKRVAKCLSRALLRDSDTIARFGGEEFAAVLPATGVDGAVAIARRMLDAVVSMGIKHDGSPPSCVVTVSLGIASITPAYEFSPECLVEAADKALYRAKASGRNQLRIGDVIQSRLTVAAE